MADRCERTELLVDQCAHCKGHRSIEDQVTDERSELRAHLVEYVHGWFESQYSGVCYGCGERFEIGAAIRRKPAALGVAYVAECCAEATSA